MEEREISLIGKEQASRAMKRVLDVMKQETTTPLTNPQSSLGGFIGGEAQAVYTARKLYGECLMGNVQTNAVARAMAVLEQSASIGCYCCGAYCWFGRCCAWVCTCFRSTY